MTFLEVDGRFKVLPCRWLQALFCLLLTSQTPLTSVRSIRAEPGHLRSPSDSESANLVGFLFFKKGGRVEDDDRRHACLRCCWWPYKALFIRHGVYRNVEWNCLSKMKAMTCAWKLLKEAGMAVLSFSLSLCSLSGFSKFFLRRTAKNTTTCTVLMLRKDFSTAVLYHTTSV